MSEDKGVKEFFHSNFPEKEPGDSNTNYTPKPNGHDPGFQPPEAEEEEILPLKLDRASDYAGQPLPVIDFLDDHQLFPIGHSVIFSGDGGVGKTMMLMQLMVAYVSGGIWMGSQIFNNGNPSCLFYSAEEPKDIVQPRLDTICRRMNNTPLSDLPMLQIYYGEDEDTVLFEGDRYGKTKTTHAFKRLCLTIEQTRPGLIVIDNRSQVAAGDENNRTFATGVVTALERLAQKYKCVVILLAHPSLTGMNTGTGTSGSTAWRGKARAFVYVEIPPAEQSEDGPPARDSGKRHMTLQKSNYGPQGTVLKLKWSDGIFDIERHEQTNIDQQLVRAKETFMELLRIFSEVNHTNVSTNPTATKNYAPKLFSAHPSGKKFTYKQFERAMDKLLEEKQVVNVPYGKGVNKRWKLERNI